MESTIKKVIKHWGHELWIADGTTTPYALKKILFLAGNRTSLQVHRYKKETNYVLSGTGKLYYTQDIFDIDNFLDNGMTESELAEFESNMKVLDLHEGVSFDMMPGQVHRVVAITDLEFVEASSTELDDVIRLQDDNNRKHGKIEEEHNYDKQKS